MSSMHAAECWEHYSGEDTSTLKDDFLTILTVTNAKNAAQKVTINIIYINATYTLCHHDILKKE